eukprot:8298391-Pyramimonas_sp.AAC.1
MGESPVGRQAQVAPTACASQAALPRNVANQPGRREGPGGAAAAAKAKPLEGGANSKVHRPA